MSFQHVFEKRVNDHMHNDAQPGRAPPEAEATELDMEKARPSSQLEFHDAQVHAKKDHPPRFSTLFDSAPAPVPASQPTPRQYVREYYPGPERRRGVNVPMPLFIVFAAVLFFESTLLFAYTVLGLYNNAPARLFPWAGQGRHDVVAACDGGNKEAAVNFAPNFIMPQGPAAATDIVTVTVEPSQISTSSWSSAPSTSSSSTSVATSSAPTSASTDAAAAASQVAGILGGIATTSETAGTATATTESAKRSTATSVKLITVTPLATSSSPLPTVTATTWVDPPSSSSTSDSSDAAAWASVSSALAEAEAKLTPSPIPETASVSSSSAASPTTTEAPAESSVS